MKQRVGLWYGLVLVGLASPAEASLSGSIGGTLNSMNAFSSTGSNGSNTLSAVGMINNGETVASAVAGGIKIAAFAAGLGLVGWGLFKLFWPGKGRHDDEGVGKKIMMVIGGGALMALGYVAQMGINSLFGGLS